MVNLTLNAGQLELELAPAAGGSIFRFDHVGPDGVQHLLRPSLGNAESALGMASFPLVPFANRIRGGQFECDGVSVRLSPNMQGDPSPLHGQGWLHPWRVQSYSQHNARLHYLHQPDEWPWEYEAWQDFALDDQGLSLTLGCRNLSEKRMPCGLALHPYFPCDASTTIDTSVTSAWTIDAQTLPIAQVEATGRFDLRNRKICGAGLDNAFENWGGTATFTWPGKSKGLRMTSPDATRFQIYSPPGKAYFAAEPVQNTVAALNHPQGEWTALGLELLNQGEAREIHVVFRVFDDKFAG